MPFYQVQGMTPHKRHTVYRKSDGSLYYEELMGRRGFLGSSTLLYHLKSPAAISKAEFAGKRISDYHDNIPLIPRHFRTGTLPPPLVGNDPVMGRQVLLGNDDVRIGICSPTEKMDFFFRNSDGDEILFVLAGEGVLETILGDLPFSVGDYLVIPKGITYRMKTSEFSATSYLIIESREEVSVPSRYLDEKGHFLEHSPFCERDIRTPRNLKAYDVMGEFHILVKRGDQFTRLSYQSHPFDVIGWAGNLYPWAFHIGEFEPITGRLHMPPPVHQTFAGPGFVVCSFVPRMFDYHPQAIPAPYFHSNTDSDEVLFYVDGQFMSRKGMEPGSMTLHPMGLTHGPHPGKTEDSIGKKETKEVAVMIDTFQPLRISKIACLCEDKDYVYSWLKKN